MKEQLPSTLLSNGCAIAENKPHHFKPYSYDYLFPILMVVIGAIGTYLFIFSN